MEGEPDITLIETHIETARRRGADLVAVSMHWSVENEVYPPRRIIELGHRVVEAGADMILGHHPHIINPVEKYVPESGRFAVPEALIIYLMGNFIPDAMSVQNKTGIMMHVEVAKGMIDGRESFWIDGVD